MRAKSTAIVFCLSLVVSFGGCPSDPFSLQDARQKLRQVSGCAPAAKQHLPLSDPNFIRHGKKLYSQGREELIIRHYFQDKKNGIFVDVGSAHYKEISTTYYLEKHLGWSGIAIDALPEYAADYETHRPRTTFANFLITDVSGPPAILYKFVHPTQGHWWRFFSTQNPQRMARVKNDICPKCTIEEIRVPQITLTELLEKLGINKFDFLSMDIEGAEPAALAGFDIRRFQPQLACVEAQQPIRAELSAFFRKHDYIRLEHYLRYDSLNWYFAPRPIRRK